MQQRRASPHRARAGPGLRAASAGAAATGFALAAAAATLFLPGPARASDEMLRHQRLGRDAVAHLREYLRLDTTNPPGNELRAVEFFARLLDGAGIRYETAEPAPGRASLWARLPGGDRPALLLLHHSDVVPADPGAWEEPPFSGAVRDGYLYGRGALDTKGLGILQLEAFLELARSDSPRNRDVVFMVTADEEAGGALGVGWLVAHRPDAFRGVGFALNEGGGGTLMDGRAVWGIEVTQKVPLWLRLTSRGTPGHGSAPRPGGAVGRLLRALGKLDHDPFAPRLLPAVATYLRGLAATGGPFAADFGRIESAIGDPAFLARLEQQNPQLHALVRDTCSITRLEASDKINVIPGVATAELDCRLLPDRSPEVFLAGLRRVLADDTIEVETLMSFTPAVSNIDTELFRLLAAECARSGPGAIVLPSVTGGFTDSHFLRDRGIEAYGFSPLLVPLAEAAAIHGNNERISTEALEQGVLMMLRIVERAVFSPSRE